MVTTQYVGEAAYCDLVGVLAGGRILALDTPDGLRGEPLGETSSTWSSLPRRPVTIWSPSPGRMESPR